MKFLLCLCLLLFPLSGFAASAAPRLPARAWIVVDQASGQELTAHNADVQLAPASLTKMMTAYVLFSDLRDKKLALGNTLSVPASALKIDGATVFLSEGEAVSVDTLLQGMLVQSASDATQTLVEAASGSAGVFVERMNREAARLGMTRTRFTNVVGLDEPGHTSTARDLAMLARALQTGFPEYQKYFVQKEFVHKGITFYNRNRLLWLDGSVDGLKTGHTARAGYCLTASAQRGDQRRVAVVLGAATDTQRVQGALGLLNFGFENYDSVRLYQARQPIKTIKLYRGVRDAVSIGFEQDFYLLIPKGAASRLNAQVLTQQPMVAPIRKGQALGMLRLSLDGKPLGDYPLHALHDVGVAGVLGRGWDSIKLLFAK
jgi:D-alanyl-D-alanine carboxypeptidase/D-alanyl-D-alanine carboxypeptidase (penicillin-binding protein 5/6)